MSVKDIFNLDAVHVLATAQYHIFDPVRNRDVTQRTHMGHIPSPEPFTVKVFRFRVLKPKVPIKHRRALHDDLPQGPVIPNDFTAVFLQDFQFDGDEGTTRGTYQLHLILQRQLPSVFWKQRHRNFAATLCHPVRHKELAPEYRYGLLHVRIRLRRSSARHYPQRSVVSPPTSGMVYQHRQHRRCKVCATDAFSLQHVQDPQRREPREDYVTASNVRDSIDGECVNKVEHGRNMPPDIRGLQAHLLDR
mmetsp:Transcript_13264/g.37224  ORF Transcript_13264/g.37224 Transcript_13264/m.37224 type:complete len:248 (-) Transcript_13264:1240-1983(-)